MGTPVRSGRARTPAGAYRVTEVSGGAAAGAAATPAQPPSSTDQLRARRGITLRTRVLLALVSVAALPLLATAGGGILLARASLISQGQQALLGRAQATASKIDSYLQGTRDSLVSARQSVAALQPLLGSDDPGVREDALHSIEGIMASVRTGGAGATLGQLADFVNTSGIVVAADPTGDEGADLHQSPAVVGALAGNIIMTGASFDPDAPNDLRETFTIAVPVLPPGASAGAQPAGALVERFSLQQIVGWIHQDADMQGSGGMLVEPATGLVLAESLPPATYAFTSLAPLSKSTVQDLVTSHRYNPAKPGDQPTVQTIPGLSLSNLRPSAPRIFSAGSFGGSDASALTYVRVPLTAAPDGTPWDYLLATPQSVLTGPADQLAILAGIILLAALALSLVVGLVTARQISTWIGGAVRQLGMTASAFLRHSDDQRSTTEEQRHRLAGARSALHDLHRLGGEVTEALEQGINFVEDGYRTRGRPTYGMSAPGGGPSQFGAAALSPQEKQAWWSSWAQGLQERLRQLHEICTGLTRDAHVTADAANHMRARGAQVYTQAAAIDASLRVGGAVLTVAPRGAARGAAGRAADPEIGPGFSTRGLRLALLGLLAAFGLLPSAAFALSTARNLRSDLTSQSTSALLVQAQSNASAVDALLNQQRQELFALGSLYSAASTANSQITNDILNQALASAAGPQTQPVGSTLFSLVSVPDGHVFAASDRGSIGSSLAQLSVFRDAARGVGNTSPAYYDPEARVGWYYSAVPIRSEDQKSVIGVAVGRFPLGAIWQLLGATATSSGAQQGAYAILMEEADGVVLADSRHPQGVFTAASSLDTQTLNVLWSQGRYPNTEQPPVTKLPEVVTHLQQNQAPNAPVSFVGASGAGSVQSQFWMISLTNAPWRLVQALPLPVATSIADQLTRLDLLLLLVVAAVTAGLALLLGQSIIVPVRRLRTRFRQASRLLLTIARRQDEAAQRQEAALPPIQTTAELLSLETEEVAAMLFPQRGLHVPLAQPALPQLPSGNGHSGAYNGGSMGNSGANWGAPRDDQYTVDAAPALQQQLARVPARSPAGADERAVEALRRARNMASDWSLRQQRIMADLASALNATDELARASVEGQREAVDLGNMVGELLASAR